MQSFIILLLLACINLPFALQKNNRAGFISWISFGFVMGLAVSSLIE